MSKNQRAVHIYRFKGSGGPPDERPTESLQFWDYLELKHETLVLRGTELLHKDFCLVTANGRFIIVAAVSPPTSGPSESRTYPCALNCISNLDTVVFYVIELATGKITDKREFSREYIMIAHHYGVSLYDSLFAVMLIKSQAIQIIHVKSNGKLVDMHRIGWFNHEDDEWVLAQYRDFNGQYIAQNSMSAASSTYLRGFSPKDEDMSDPRTADRHESFALAPNNASSMEPLSETTYHQVPSGANNTNGLSPRANQPNIASNGFSAHAASRQPQCDEPHSQTLSGIKQRLMAYLFRKAFYADDGGAALRHFHLTFQQFASLVMWRMQFLDESTLLIKFGKLDCVVGKPADSSHQTAFFVFYDIHTTEILQVYDNASTEFLRLYESWADQFCATAYSTAGKDKRHYSSTCSNNVYAKDHLKKTQYGMRNARNGGPQSLSDSPYLDQALFSYDEKLISALDRQKLYQDVPIKFYLRGSGGLRFKIHLFKPSPNGNGSSSGNINNGSANGGAATTVNTTTNNNNANGAPSNPGTTTTAGGGGTGNGTAVSTTRNRRFAQFIPHPFEPFIISVIHQQQQPTIVNFHIRVPEQDASL
ncbi:acid phosphatase det1 [Linnemannia schmuckeri]|uniref:Acid phosphatase det1 n=1 Tax=Linnemannia schmuckeri TaxID=64567 RepID=A0A9P5VDM9_9FUNG|nr:acid phosphatase det1 [Linnemannia schmuckeri]